MLKHIQKWLYNRRTRKLNRQPLVSNVSRIFGDMDENEMSYSGNNDRINHYKERSRLMSKTTGRF